MADKKETAYEKEIRELGGLMKNEFFRSFVMNHIVDPSRVFMNLTSSDPIAHVKENARQEIAKDIIENMKEADFGLYCQMELEHREKDERENE